MARWGLVLLLAAASALAHSKELSLQLSDGATVRYAVLDASSPLPSARDSARRVLSHLAAGEIEEAALLSNSPKRRYEVLRDYLASVGEAAFRRVFARYLAPGNEVLAEIAIGPRRLLIWELGEARNHLAGQYYVEVEGRFFMDDVPSEARGQLRYVLEAYRSGKAAN